MKDNLLKIRLLKLELHFIDFQVNKRLVLKLL